MNQDRFDAVREELNEYCEDLLASKGADYTAGGDRLDNFKQVAKDLGLTPLQVWAVYFRKHIIAIQKFVRSGELADEILQSRFADARNYLDLGWALVSEDEGD